MNEIDLWDEAEGMFMEGDTDKDKDIAYNLFQLFEWSDYPTAEDDFDEIYSRIWEGESLTDILNKKESE